MKKLMIKVLSIFLISLTASAETVTIEKDQKAPFKGVLMDTETAEQAKKDIESARILREMNTSFKETINLLQEKNIQTEKQKDIVIEQNLKYTKEIQKARSTTDLEKIVIFALGIGSTILLYNVVKNTN